MERKSLRRVYGRRMFQGALFASTALSYPALAQAQIAPTTTPQGGVVVGGSASIAQAPGATTINQTSQRTAINWQSFDVGSDAKVQFNQPDAAAVALNRVTGGNLSQINGQINANGQIVLINQSGVVFGQGAQVNAESVVVSTADIPTGSFMAGSNAFTIAPKPGAQIINNGHITARDAGLVGLVAPQVANHGVITATLGQVVLAGASAFTLDLYGDRLISLDVTQAVRAVDVGGKAVPALVTNSGIIIADGGKITLTAQDADALVTQLINAGGTIRADTVGGNAGTISLQGVGGNIQIAGNLLARGTAAGTGGGAIAALTTGTVAVAPGAVIDASGDAGGGVVALGTDLARAEQGPTDTSAPVAAVVTIAQGAKIHADTTGIGNGGTVTVLSQNLTQFGGDITAIGGAGGGNGGLVEISSHGVINLGGTVTDTAIDGKAGEILLDPTSITIVTGGNSSTSASQISPGYLDGLSGDVVISASNFIEVLNDVSIGAAHTMLDLTAGGNISIMASIFVNGSLEINAGNSLYIGPDISALGQLTDGGGLTATDMTLESGAGGTLIDAPITATGTLALASAGTIFEQATNALELVTPVIITGNITTPTLTSDGGTIGDNVILVDSGNVIGALGDFAANGEIGLSDTGPLNIAGLVKTPSVLALLGTGTISESTGMLSADLFYTDGATIGGALLLGNLNHIGTVGGITLTGNLLLNNAGSIALTGTLNTPGSISLETPGGITERAGGGLTAAALDSGGTTVGGDVTLGGTNNIGTLQNFRAAGSFALTNASALTIEGVLKATDILLAGPTLVLSGGEAATDIVAGSAGAPGELSLFTDHLDPGFGSVTVSVPGGTVQIAPLTGSDGITVQTASVAVAGALVLTDDFVELLGATANKILLGSGTQTGAISIGAVGGDDLELGTATLDLLTSAAIDEFGTLNVGTLAFSGGGFTEAAAGTIGATLVEGDGGAITGGVTLVSPTNQIGTIANLTISGDHLLALQDNLNGTLHAAGLRAGTIVLETEKSLELDGNIFGTTAVSLTADTGNIRQSAGTIDTGMLSLNGGEIILAGNNQVSTLGLVSATDFDFTDISALSLAGLVSVSGGIQLNDGAGIAALAGGTIFAVSLGLAGGPVSLGNANQVGTLGGVTLGTAALDFVDTGLLTIAGVLSAGSATIASDTIDLAGQIDATTLVLGAGAGGIAQTGGRIVAGTLAGLGSIGGDAFITLNNTIADLGAFTLGGTLALNDSEILTIMSGIELDGGAASITGAGVTEANAGSIVGGGDFGASVSGSVLLTNGANSFTGILGITAGGAAVVDNDATTQLLGGVTASSVYIALGTGKTLNFNSQQLSATAAHGTISVIADALSDQVADSLFVPTGTIVIAPATATDTIDINATGGTTPLTLVAGDFGNAATVIFGDAANTGGINIGGSGAQHFGSETIELISQGAGFQAGVLTAGTLGIFTGGFTQSGSAGITADTVFGTAAGAILLVGTKNAFGTIGGLSASALISLYDSAADNLVLAGLIAAPSVTLTTNGTGEGVTEVSGGTIDTATLSAIGIAGDALLGNANTIGQLAGFTVSGDILLDNIGTLNISGGVATPGTFTLADNAGVFESTGFIQAGTLTGDGSAIGGDVSLASGQNTIATLADFRVGNGFGLDLVDTGGLDLAGTVSAGNATISADSIVISGLIDAATLLKLGAGANGILESTGTIVAATLAGAGAITGTVALNNFNTINTLGAFDITAGDFSLANTGALTLAGNINLGAGDTLALGSTGKLTQIGGTLDVGFLTSDGGTIGGAVSFGSLGNAIGTLGNFAASGDIDIGGGAALVIGGTVATPGELAFQNSSAEGVVEAGGAVIAGTLAGSLSAGNLDIGGTANTIGILGAITAKNITVQDTGSLALTGLISATSALKLLTGGDLTELAGGNISAGTLTSDGGTIGGDVLLGRTNSIASLGNFAATGDFTLVDQTALDVIGALQAANIALTTPTITLDGDITAGAAATPGTLALVTDAITVNSGGFLAPDGTIELAPETFGAIDLGGSGANALDLSAGVLAAFDSTAAEIILGSALGLTTGTIRIENSVAIGPTLLALAATGNITDTGTLTANGLQFAAAGFTQSGAGEIDATSLSGTGGSLVLAGTLNNIGTLGAVSLTGSLALTDAAALTLTGPVLAKDATLEDLVAIAFAGKLSVNSGGTIILVADGLSATGGTIQAPGGAVEIAPYTAGRDIDLGGTTAGDLSLDAALINLIDATLLQIGTAAGHAGGTITDTGDLTIAPGTLALVGTALLFEGSLTEAGLLSLASTGTIAETAGAMITAGTITGDGNGIGLIGTNAIGTLGDVSSSGNIVIDNTGSLLIAGLVQTPDDISVEGQFFREIAGGTLVAATLNSGGTEIGGDVFLTNANSIGTIADFSIASGGTLDYVAAGALTLGSGIIAPDATFTATSLAFDGDIYSANTLALAIAHGVTQNAGIIIAGTLIGLGTIGGDVSLTDQNAIATLGNFTLAAGHTLALTDAGTLTIAGNVAASVATLAAGSIDLAGDIDGTALALESTGDISESTGTIGVATLTSGGATIGGDVALGNGNDIGTLGGFAAAGDIALNDVAALAIAGAVRTPGIFSLTDTGDVVETTGKLTAGTLSGSATNFQLTNANTIGALGNLSATHTLALDDTGPLAVNGGVSATFVTLNAGAIEIAGAINATLLALDSAGTIAETTGTIGASTLTSGGGTIGGDLTLLAANAIGTLGGIAADGNIAVNDATTLAIAGLVQTPGTISLEGSADIFETTGTLAAAALTSGSGAIGGDLRLTNANTIASLGALTLGAGDTLALTDIGHLAVDGPVVAAVATLTADAIAFDGNISGNLLALGSTGAITQNSGAISEATLVSLGTIGGNVSLLDANSIASLGAFTLAAGHNFALADTGLLTVTGPVDASNISLSSGRITLAGNVDGTVLDLGATGAITQSAGILSVATLLSLGTIAGNVLLLDENSIASIGAFTVAAGHTLALNDTGLLTVSGSVTAPVATLAAGTIVIAGGIDATQLALESRGNITETTGTVTAGTITSGGTTIGGALSLLKANSIGTLGAIAARGDIAVNDVTALDIAGLVSTPGSITLEGRADITEIAGGTLAAATLNSGNTTIGGDFLLGNANTIGALGAITLAAGHTLALTDTGLLTVAGRVVAPFATLAADDIAIAGAIDATQLALESAGDVTETTGTISAGTLTSGGGTIGGAVNLANSNSIATLGDFAAAGDIIFDDGAGYDIAGLVSTPGALTLEGAGMTESGAIDAAVLTTGATTLTGSAALNSANQIATLGDFAATGGLALNDLAPLAIDGAVNLGGPLALRDTGDITQTGGTISATALTSDGGTIGGAVNLGNVTIATLGDFAAADLALNDARALNVNGAVAIAGTLALLAAGNITQTGGAISAAALTSNGGTIGGAASFAAAGNTIASLGDFAAAGGLTLNDATGLALTGDIITDAGVLNLDVAGAIAQGAGTIATALLNASATAITLADANDILALGNIATGNLLANGVFAVTGPVSAGNATILSPGSLQVSGNIEATGGVLLRAQGNLTQSAGTIHAATASISAQNIVQNAGQITAGSGDLLATGGIDLAGTDGFAGNLLARAGYGDISQSGHLTATNIDFSTGGNIALSGAILAGNLIGMTAGLGIVDHATQLTAANASFTAAHGNITLDGDNSVAGTLNASAGGEIAQDSGRLASAVLRLQGTGIDQSGGAIAAGSATMQSSGAIAVNGAANITSTLDLIAAGNITHTAGVLTAATLVGSAGTLAQFGATTDFGTLGSFILQDSLFQLANAGTLTITGPVVANVISISAVGLVTLAGSPDGGLFFRGQIDPPTTLTPETDDSSITVTQGANGIQPSITQTGVFYLDAGPDAQQYLGTADQAATLFLTTTPDGDISFAPAPPNNAGLFGPSVDVVMSAGPGGIIAGNIDLLRVVILSAQSVALTGTLDGVSGSAGAGKGFVNPFPEPPFRFNACPIGSVNCTILPVESLPSGNPLENFDITQRKRKRLDKNIDLPGIATRDF